MSALNSGVANAEHLFALLNKMVPQLRSCAIG